MRASVSEIDLRLIAHPVVPPIQTPTGRAHVASPSRARTSLRELAGSLSAPFGQSPRTYSRVDSLDRLLFFYIHTVYQLGHADVLRTFSLCKTIPARSERVASATVRVPSRLRLCRGSRCTVDLMSKHQSSLCKENNNLSKLSTRLYVRAD